MDILTIKPANTFYNNKKGYITAWQSDQTHMSNLFGEVMPIYESVQSWPIYPTKAIAQYVIKLIAILAYLNTLDYKVTVYNTSCTFYGERDNLYLLLYTGDQTLLEYYDSAVVELIEDGFIDPRNVHESTVDYYNHLNSHA